MLLTAFLRVEKAQFRKKGSFPFGKAMAINMNTYQFGLIGTGNMGGALAKALARTVPGDQIFLADRSCERASALASELGCRFGTNEEAAASCRFLLLGVKPQMMGDMLAGIGPVLAARQDRFILVTMAAGLTLDTVAGMAGGAYPMIRIMPNMPAAVGQGMILYCPNALVSEEETGIFARAMSGAGQLDRLEESLIDAGCALSGCGPAFVFQLIEAMADGGVYCGLPRSKAMLYAAQTVLGSAQQLLSSGRHPGELKDAVCSPGGSTIAGVRRLEQSGFRGAAADAVIAAYEKTKELGKKS